MASARERHFFFRFAADLKSFMTFRKTSCQFPPVVMFAFHPGGKHSYRGAGHRKVLV